jgi:hypothetical protein
VGTYATVIESKTELEASLKNFLAGLKGRVLSRRMTTTSRSDGRPLPAVLFIFAADSISGSGKIVTDDNRTYIAMGAKFNDQNGDDTEIDRFMLSFRLTAKP